MSIGAQVVSSLRWMASARFAAQAITWVITIVVVRILNPADYGLMAMAMVPVGLLALLDEMGMGSALVQRSEVSKQEIESVFGILLIVHAALYAAVFAAAPLLAMYYDEPRVTDLVRVLAIRIPVMSLAVIPEAVLRRRMNFRAISVATFLAATANGAVTLGMALTGAGVWSLVGGALAGGVVRTVSLIIASRQPMRVRWNFSGMGAVLGFGSLVTLNRVLWYLYSQADVLIIGRLLGKDLLGYYAVAMHLATLPMSKIAGIMNEVGFAAFSRVQRDLAQVRSHFRKAVRLVAMFAFPVFLGVSSVSPEIVTVVLGTKWTPATVPLAVLSLVVPLRMLATMIAPTLIGLGRPGLSTTNQVLGCILVPSAILFAAPGGLNAIAMSWLVSFPVFFLMVLARSLPVIGVKPGEYARDIAIPALAGGAMYLAVAAARAGLARIDATEGLRLAVLCGCGVIVYLSVTWAVGRQRIQEVLSTIRS